MSASVAQFRVGQILRAQQQNQFIPTVTNAVGFGATGGGVVDDVGAIQSALDYIGNNGGGTLYLPPGTYAISHSLFVPSNTRITGAGAASVLSVMSSWVTLPLPFAANMIFANENYAASVITDSNITIDNLCFTYVNHPGLLPHGGSDCIRFYMCENTKVSNCSFFYGDEGVTHLGCNNTQVIGCSSYYQSGCPYDWFGGSSNARLIGCYAINTPTQPRVNVSQFACFNGQNVTAGPPALTADGFIMSGCEFVNQNSALLTINLFPIGSINETKNIQIVGNKFDGVIQVVGTGNCHDVVVSSNTWVNVGGVAAVAFFTDGTTVPFNISVIGNLVVDPKTTTGSLGVFRITADNYTIIGNTVTGTDYLGFACYVGTFAGVLGTNNFSTAGQGQIDAGTGAVSNQTNLLLPNTFGYGWVDAAGNACRWFLQADNNHVFAGTNGTGATRNIWSIQQESSSSAFIFYPTVEMGVAGANALKASGASTGNQPLFQAVGSDTNVMLDLAGQGSFGVRGHAFSFANAPTASTLTAGTWGVFKLSSDGSVGLYYNDGGSIKKVALT